jgi:glyoxylase-like metal-dependent hydrolase (beta-lactamase superfamily II)/rhodanese-related sulfurtransferase
MILKQYYLDYLEHASYLVADEEAQVAAVVDPQRDVDRYVEDARALGCAITHVFLTHLHSDFIAGHIELRERAGARIFLGASADAEYRFTPVEDGDVFNLGSVSVEVLETPGHTREAISLLVYDHRQGGDVPHAVLTGDTLLVGDVGRPDLAVPASLDAYHLATMLYFSVHHKLLWLPDTTLVYPAHGPGTAGTRGPAGRPVSTIDQERASNPFGRATGKREFMRRVTSDGREVPRYFEHVTLLNRLERGTLDEALAAASRELTFEEAVALRDGGACLLDTRGPDEYAAGHVAGSVNIGLDGKFAAWAGSLLEYGAPVVIFARPGAWREAALRLGRIGIDSLAGFVNVGSPEAVPAAFRRTTPRVAPGDLAEALGRDRSRPFVLDVRTRREWQEWRIDGSVNIPLGDLAGRLAEVPRDRPVVVLCAGSYRSSAAVGLLERAGVADPAEVSGGIVAWTAAGMRTTNDQEQMALEWLSLRA